MQRKIELIVGKSYRIKGKVYKAGQEYLVPVEEAKYLLKSRTFGGESYFRLVPEALPKDELLEEIETEQEPPKELTDSEYDEFFEDDVRASAAV